jgi:predicted metalloendopeptidase
MTPSAVNAYYAPTRNQIVFPGGILQEPFYHRDYPASINFGGIGTIIAHELSHGFDDTGRDYDKTGNLKQWWNNKTIERFKNASECMIHQYSNYELDGEKVNGKRTLGENIADNGALRTSFMAYLDWINEHGEEKDLPLVNMNHKQLYFVSFAQVFIIRIPYLTFRNVSLRNY